jgi:hypothetical protein
MEMRASGSGVIALNDALYRAGWIDRGGRFTCPLSAQQRVEGEWGTGMAISEDGKIALWERDSFWNVDGGLLAGAEEGSELIELCLEHGNQGRRLIQVTLRSRVFQSGGDLLELAGPDAARRTLK